MKSDKLISVGLWLISGLLGVLIALMVVIWDDHNKRQDLDNLRQDQVTKELKNLLTNMTKNIEQNTISLETVRKYILVTDGVDLDKIEWEKVVERLKTGAIVTDQEKERHATPGHRAAGATSGPELTTIN